MNTVLEALSATEAFLSSKGINVAIEAGPITSAKAVDAFCRTNDARLPREFVSFYTEIANGYSFMWEGPEDAFGHFCLPAVSELGSELREWRRFVDSYADDPQEVEECVGAQHAARALAIWQAMRSWVPFWDEGNGDHFCLDTKTGAVVYDQHDWYDGFGQLANTNGILAGRTFTEFVVQWSRFCFQRNKSLWWGEFEKFGAILWEPAYFNERYYRME